jgi:DNA-binding transcriptional LysR family regulator
MSKPASAPSEMAFFNLLVRAGSFSAAGRLLELTTPAVSKRLALLESRLGVRLLNRSTRRISLTHEGELYVNHARRILAEIEEMEREVSAAVETPRGLLRVNATLGFGRSHIAPLISRFIKAHPEVQVQLQLTVDPPPIAEDGFDVCVQFGEPPEARVIARRLAANRRVLCATPAYLARHGTPKAPRDLVHHNCITIRQGDEAYGLWRLGTGKRAETVKVRGNLSTSDGGIAVGWALDGHGILLRAEWDIARYLRSGRLVTVLDGYPAPPADIYAVYPQRHQGTARVRALVDFLVAGFAGAAPGELGARW